MWKAVTETTVGGFEVLRIAVFFAAVLVALVVGRLAQFMMKRSAGKAQAAERELLGVVLTALAKPTALLVFAVGASLWFSTEAAAIGIRSPGAFTILDLALRILRTVAVGYTVYSLVDVVDHYLTSFASRTESKVDDLLAPLLGKSVRITLAVLVILNIAHVVSGKNITTILAGFGLGGLAVALAAQDTIKNFFGSLVILADKPFEIGDRIVIDGHDGPIERVGFRSTKIRTLDGHLVTVPNAELANRTILNVGKRPYIRRLANITITYDTPPEKVSRAVEILHEILDNHEGMESEFPPRIFFNEFNDCSLNILAVYWYHPPDYWKFMQFTQGVNMQILERFNAEGIEFAFPTRTIYAANDDRRQLALRLLQDPEGPELPGGCV